MHTDSQTFKPDGFRERPIDPPAYKVRPRTEFQELPRERQLDALDVAIRVNPDVYGQAQAEAFAESRYANELFAKLFDNLIDDTEIGALVRKMQIEYAASVARARCDDLAEFL